MDRSTYHAIYYVHVSRSAFYIPSHTDCEAITFHQTICELCHGMTNYDVSPILRQWKRKGELTIVRNKDVIGNENSIKSTRKDAMKELNKRKTDILLPCGVYVK